MTSKYWTSNRKSSENCKEFVDAERKVAVAETADDSTSCGDSIQDDIVTVRNNMKNINSDERSKAFTSAISTSSIIKPRPDSLKLSFDYGSSSDLLGKSASSTVDVNQSKSLSVAGNMSHQDGKKSTSYDLWVNENIEAKDRNESSSTGEKKLDLPGRVSFR